MLNHGLQCKIDTNISSSRAILYTHRQKHTHNLNCPKWEILNTTHEYMYTNEAILEVNGVGRTSKSQVYTNNIYTILTQRKESIKKTK